MADDLNRPADGRPHGVNALLDTPYARYLNLDTLFDIQIAATDGDELRHPEEELFRTVHLTSELWLRFAGSDVVRAGAALGAERIIPATRLLCRATGSVTRVIEATSMLDAMPIADYHLFRVHFGEASGLQSPGYAWLRRECRALAARLDTIVEDDDTLFALYTTGRDDPRYDLCEALLDLDAAIDRFRGRHVQIAERFLGESTPGTGGQGIGYLRERLGQRIFPRLWMLRQRVADSAGSVPYGYGTSRAT